MTTADACVHCEVRPVRIRMHHLCDRCHLRRRRGLPPLVGAGREPTAAELDALVAEQMDNLPAWWATAAAAQARAAGEADDAGRRVAGVRRIQIARGRGL